MGPLRAQHARGSRRRRGDRRRRRRSTPPTGSHRKAVHYLNWLAEVRDDLPDALREAEAHAFEPKPEDAALLRYEGHLSREFHRSLGNLVKLTKSGDDLVEIEIENAPNEPNLTTESIAGEGIVADLEIAETVKKPRDLTAMHGGEG